MTGPKPTIFRGCALGWDQLIEKLKAYHLAFEEMRPRKQHAR